MGKKKDLENLFIQLVKYLEKDISKMNYQLDIGKYIMRMEI